MRARARARARAGVGCGWWVWVWGCGCGCVCVCLRLHSFGERGRRERERELHPCLVGYSRCCVFRKPGDIVVKLLVPCMMCRRVCIAHLLSFLPHGSKGCDYRVMSHRGRSGRVNVERMLWLTICGKDKLHRGLDLHKLDDDSDGCCFNMCRGGPLLFWPRYPG